MTCVGLLAGCESTDMKADNRAEKRELANRQAAQQQTPQDEAQQNLLSAQRNVLNRDGNPMRY